MIAAIAGDIIGSVHERAHLKRTAFTLFKRNSKFTDDTVLTAAVADSLLNGVDYATSIRTWARTHPEGIKGAQAVALAIFLARKGSDKAVIRKEMKRCFSYDMKRSVAQIRPRYKFDVTCQGSVPESIIAFLDSDDVESAIRLAVSLGGDADTQACMAGGIAQAYYKAIPEAIIQEVEARLTPDVLQILKEFEERYDVVYERI